jgi:poly(hydroxyalkanoate) granule-associated protein
MRTCLVFIVGVTMVKKLQKLSADKKASSSFTDSVKDSAQQIWLAGLGAFSKAQEERGKAFDTLVKEGLTLQRKTQVAAEEKISEATARMATMATGLTSKATGISSMATGQWDKLENIFEERVAKALNKLGVPTSKEVAALVARIDELNQSVQKLSGVSSKPVGKSTAKAAPKPVTKATKTTKAPAKAPAKAAAKPAEKSPVTPKPRKAPVKSAV